MIATKKVKKPSVIKNVKAVEDHLYLRVMNSTGIKIEDSQYRLDVQNVEKQNVAHQNSKIGKLNQKSRNQQKNLRL